MRPQAVFHFSFYVTLALAVVCLALPSTFFLGWMPYFAGGVLVALYLAWRHERAWVLSETAANHLGVFIAVGAAGWILFQIPRDEQELIRGGVNWPAGLLPHLGPLLMVLLVVRLFRPKRFPDCWVIQTMGLMMVTLAAVLADERLFGLLLVLYLASLIWCLVLHCPRRAQLLVQRTGDPNQAALFDAPLDALAPAEPALPAPWRLPGLLKAGQWSAAVIVLGYLLFLAAPRQGQWQWNPRQLSALSTASSRSAELASIDLNRTGRIELSEEPAFLVSVVDHEGQTRDATRIRRWRQEVVEIYHSGRWYSRTAELPARNSNSRTTPARAKPERIPEGQWLVSFQVKPQVAGGLVLADPVDPGLGIGLDPVLDGKPQAVGFFLSLQNTDSVVGVPKGVRRTHAYAQVVSIRGDAERRAAPGVDRGYARFLSNQAVPKALAPWTRGLLERLPATRGLMDQLDERGRLPATVHAMAATGLCRHLAHSGEYGYSLELRREKPELDVTADFLMHVKEGHCERYAGGLALMLRTLGIRCRLVKGYLAAETADEGASMIRLNQAHSWVEALVPGNEPNSWEWLTLDPTPSAAAQAGNLDSWLHWFQTRFVDVHKFWRNLVLDYTPETQSGLLEDLLRVATTRKGLLLLAALGGCTAAVLLRRRLCGLAARGWRTSARLFVRLSPYEDMTAWMRKRLGLAPQPGQTPREFACAAALALQRLGMPVELSLIPERIVAAHYEASFGGRAPDRAAQDHARQLVADLRAALGGSPTC